MFKFILNKILPYYLFLVVIGVCLYNYENIKEQKIKDFPNSGSKLDELMNFEPKVKDWILTDVPILYVCVVDDGTDRKGLAMYFCQILVDSGRSDCKWVKIVEYGTMNSSNRDNAYGVLLGEYKRDW